jgi:hypothetical protein
MLGSVFQNCQVPPNWWRYGMPPEFFCKYFWNILDNWLSRENSHAIGASSLTDDSGASVFYHNYCEANCWELSDANVLDA